MSKHPDDIPEHLAFIRAVIERHARSSFLIKGWSVTIVAALVVLAARGQEPLLAVAAGFPLALTFWGLDAYYLRQERLYRALYDYVRKREPDANDRFTLDAGRFRNQVPSWDATMRARTVISVHLVLIMVLAMALAYVSVGCPDGT